MVSDSVVLAIAVISFSVGVLLGRRGASTRVVTPRAVDARVVDVPPRDSTERAPASVDSSAARAVRDTELTRYLESGQLISAIKRYRDLTGVGLRGQGSRCGAAARPMIGRALTWRCSRQARIAAEALRLGAWRVASASMLVGRILNRSLAAELRR